MTLAVMALLAFAVPARAHRAATGGPAPEDAIAIPNLSHGQMRALADHWPAIMDLAERQGPTDPTMRRLQGFISIQRFACAFGIMPGSVADEDSPFNECSHAYLAAARSLLLHLKAMPGGASEKKALVDAVEREMLEDGASLVLCRYSDEPFNTAAIVAPHWAAIPAHPPTALLLGGLALAFCGVGLMLRRRSA